MIYPCGVSQTWLVGFGQCTLCDDSAVSSTEEKNVTAPAPSRDFLLKARDSIIVSSKGDMQRLLMAFSLSCERC